jgi:hypothetical protein
MSVGMRKYVAPDPRAPLLLNEHWGSGRSFDPGLAELAYQFASDSSAIANYSMSPPYKVMIHCQHGSKVGHLPPVVSCIIATWRVTTSKRSSPFGDPATALFSSPGTPDDVARMCPRNRVKALCPDVVLLVDAWRLRPRLAPFSGQAGPVRLGPRPPSYRRTRDRSYGALTCRVSSLRRDLNPLTSGIYEPPPTCEVSMPQLVIRYFMRRHGRHGST